MLKNLVQAGLQIFVLTTIALISVDASALPAINDPKIEKLSTAKITLGSRSITVEIADDDPERERGLMYRKSMGPNEGMLFIFEETQPMAFWMKNTMIPLSIGYFDELRRLINVEEMVPAVMGEARPKTYPALKPAKFALEMNKGWFAKHKIKPGAELRLPKTFVERK